MGFGAGRTVLSGQYWVVVQRLDLVSVARSDWGHLEGLFHALQEYFDVAVVHQRGHEIDIGREVQWFGNYFRKRRPDALLVFGDRWEQMAAAVATITQNIPVIHLHAGEWTPNAFDNQCRRVISSLAHLFLVAHEVHRDRLCRMGIPPSRIHVTGAPGLDRFLLPGVPREEVAEELGLDPAREWALVMLHPTTFQPEDAEEEWQRAMEAIGDRQPIWFLPGNDPGAALLTSRMPETAIEDLPDDLYRSLLRHAVVMIGNSSALLIDAPFVGLKTIEIGRRQAGRDRVPYGDGQSIPRILNILKDLTFRDFLCEAS